MKPRDEVRRELVEQWLAKAEEDFAVAGQLASGEEPFWASAAFHAQQAAEKYLKAFLVEHQTEFRKTHDLGALLDLVAEIDKAFADSLGDLTALNPYGVEARYPGDYPDVGRQDAEEAVSLAGRVRQAVRRALGCRE